MASENQYDAVVVGAGPNGLAAAINLSRARRRVLLIEGANTIGGGMRTDSLTLPGYFSDICSSVHPLAVASPFFRRLNLEERGVSWIQPEIALAHPFQDGSVLFLHRSLEATCDALGADGRSYARLMSSFVDHYEKILPDLLGPIRIPRHPVLTGRFGLLALRSLASLARSAFTDPRVHAMMAGLAAHAMVPLDRPATASFALVLAGLAHGAGWPLVRGGSQTLADSLAQSFTDLGGEIVTGRTVSSLSDMPQAQHYFFDLTPRQLLNITGLELSEGYRARLGRFRYGPGVFKIDWALREAIPWRADMCRKAGTVHLGESLESINESIVAAVSGKRSPSPYLIVGQPSLFDAGRAPEGRHVAWAYCHAPADSAEDLTASVEDLIERYAPGFREIILARHHFTAQAMEAHNPNYVGGDIGGGAADWRQLFSRPVLSCNPYRTSNHSMYLCSASTPPGGGVHGLCGYYATASVVKP